MINTSQMKSEEPANGGGVALHADSVALITIDVQVDTLDGQPFEIPGTTAASERIEALANAFRATDRPVVHVVRIYLPDGSNAEPFRRGMVSGDVPMLWPDAPGTELAPGLLPEGAAGLDADLLLKGGVQRVGLQDHIVYKPRWGAFYQTALEGLLAEMEVDALVVAGCNFPNCPRATIFEASERDYHVVVANDAVSGLTEGRCAELAGIGVDVLSTHEVIAALAGAHR
jgi:nicotinamidase-related amidase